MRKHRIGLTIEKNAYVDGGDGLISFPSGQVITDTSKQRNGTMYDIASMDLSEYKGQITADHYDELDSYIGEALGVAKTEDAVTISGIRFATKNALGLVAYNLMKDGFPLDLSIETYGPWPDESDDTYYNAKLIGLSVVIVGNNKSATMGKAKMALVRNSLAQAKEQGLDTSEAEKLLEPEGEPAPKPEPVEPQAPEPEAPIKQEQNMFVTIKNSRDFALKISYKNAAGDTVETELAPGATVDVSEDQKEAIEAQVSGATAPQPDLTEAIAAAVNAVTAPLIEKFDKLEQSIFDKSVQVPELKPDKTTNAAPKVGTGVTDFAKELNSMDYREVHGMQLTNAWNWLKGGDVEAAMTLNKINKHNIDKLKAEGIVENSVSLADFGNFVISPELITEIQGIRTDYSRLVDATTWKDTLSVQMAWLARSGDIDMQPVGFLDSATNGTFPNGNLKPLSKYSANLKTKNLEELAAVTPVMNSTTRFFAADLLSDVAKGYRNDFDRKRAQLIVALLQQAVNGNGASVAYNLPNPVAGVIDFLKVWTKIGEKTPNGTYIIGTSSFAELQTQALSAGTNGPLANIFTSGRDGVPNIFGRPYLVVSDDLLPRLNSNETRNFTINGQAVPITSSVFYFDLSNFTGRTSGGLNYDLSMEAAYEEAGVVKSAYQRNEMVLRGSFFRGGAILDTDQVSSLVAPGLS